MVALRLLLTALVLALVTYTSSVVASFGWNFLPSYFEDVARLDWTGQFVFDFTILLSLAALWVAWRNHFSAVGVTLAILAVPFGSMMVGGYLLYLTFREGGNMTRILVGDREGLR